MTDDGEATEPVEVTQEDLDENYAVDMRALNEAAGAPEPWAHEFTEMVGHATGCWIEPSALEKWMESYAQQVRREALREAAFMVANTALPARIKGDPSLLMLELRDDIARRLKTGVQ